MWSLDRWGANPCPQFDGGVGDNGELVTNMQLYYGSHEKDERPLPFAWRLNEPEHPLQESVRGFFILE